MFLKFSEKLSMKYLNFNIITQNAIDIEYLNNYIYKLLTYR
jgi:hypothetical protein